MSTKELDCDGCTQPKRTLAEWNMPAAPPRHYIFPYGKQHPQSTLGTLVKSNVVFHPNGDIEFPKTRLYDDIEGYERDTEQPWLFHPVWPACELRAQTAWIKANGSLEISMWCQQPESVENDKLVRCSTCESCPIRKAAQG